MRATTCATLALAILAAGCGADTSTTSSGPSSPPPPAAAGASSVPVGASARRCPSEGRLIGLRVSGIGCDQGRTLMLTWNSRCLPAGGASRSACTVRRYRCQAVAVDRGVSVSCARAGRSASFLRRR